MQIAFQNFLQVSQILDNFIIPNDAVNEDTFVLYQYCTVPTSTVRWQNLVIFCHTIPSNESSHAIFSYATNANTV